TGVKPLDDPEFDGLDDAELENGEPLVFKIKITASPHVKLGDYTAIK
ncbi:MAG TPA: trigger factor, partial [Firmicutes bacterium]|nr:trigger factor [Bacillota bacterium]